MYCQVFCTNFMYYFFEVLKMNLFTTRLADLIFQSGKKQTEICKDLDFKKQKFTNWKSGYCEPDIDSLILLATYFEVSIDYLVGIEDEFGNKTYIDNPTYTPTPSAPTQTVYTFYRSKDNLQPPTKREMTTEEQEKAAKLFDEEDD